MKILISGWYGMNNTGDELILNVLLEYCSNHDVTVLTRGVIDSARAASVFHSDIFRFDLMGLRQWLSGKPLKLLAALAKTDCFVLGGGGILRESGNYVNLNRLLDEIHLSRAMRKKIFVYGVSIGPIASERGHKMIAKAMKKCDFITVRDIQSMLFLEEIGIPESRRLLAPDPAYSIGSRLPEANIGHTNAYKEITVNEKIPIFLALGLIKDGEDMSKLECLAACLDKISEDFKVSFVSIPFRKTEGGLIDDAYVAKELKKRTTRALTLSCLDEAYDCGQIERIVENSPFVICVRLHAMIISIARSTPFLAISYDRKVTDSALLADVTDLVIEPDEELCKNLYESFAKNYRDRAALKARLEIKSAKLAEDSGKVFRALDDVMNNSRDIG